MDASIELSFGDSSFEGNRYNMTLYTFVGELCARDHVFVQTEATDPETKMAKGTYIFRSSGVFEDIENFMWEHDFPMNLNAIEVAECDEIAFQTQLDQLANFEEIDDYVPEEWLNNEPGA